jgi:hypothetical protein
VGQDHHAAFSAPSAELRHQTMTACVACYLPEIGDWLQPLSKQVFALVTGRNR